MIDIKKLKELNSLEHYAITVHAKTRLYERNISIDDVVSCISNGEIIKQYENDKPLPSCLVLGISVNNKYLHVVVSHDEEFIYLITAYYPDPEKWSKNFKTRRK